MNLEQLSQRIQSYSLVYVRVDLQYYISACFAENVFSHLKHQILQKVVGNERAFTSLLAFKLHFKAFTLHLQVFFNTEGV